MKTKKEQPMAPAVNAGILPSCFDSGEYKPITEQKLQARVRKEGALSSVCYEAALCLAKGEKLLTEEQVAAIKRSTKGTPGTNYTEQYRKIMNLDDPATLKTSINDSNDTSTLRLNDITQSGFLNIKTLEGHFIQYTHTAYIQVTADGKRFLYSANGGAFDNALVRSGEEFVDIKSTKRFQLSDRIVESLNDYFKADPATNKPQMGFNYTPAEEAATSVGRQTECNI
ncbi:MAG: hypothetical protein RPU61_09570 [Candidatus Sedimenticola sp. (ex Thyasira tokunagai)]